MDNKEFEEIYNKTVKANIKELTFFWSYSYVPEFLLTILKTDEELDLDSKKHFALVPKPVQYAFYCWCVEHNKLFLHLF